MIVLAVEAVAGAEIIQRWVDIPIWASSLVLMLLLTLTNLASVKSYGEFEFWFASIKVAAIIAFIVLVLAFALGLIAAIVVVIGSMAVVDDVRDQLWWSLGSLAVVLIAAWARNLQPSRTTSGQATSSASTT